MAIGVKAVPPLAHTQARLAKAGAESCLVAETREMASAVRNALNAIASLNVHRA